MYPLGGSSENAHLGLKLKIAIFMEKVQQKQIQDTRFIINIFFFYGPISLLCSSCSNVKADFFWLAFSFPTEKKRP